MTVVDQLAPVATDEIGFYSPGEVESLTTLSRVTIWRMARNEQFPAAVVLTPGRIGYPRGAVNAWLRDTERKGTKLSRNPPRPAAGRKDAPKHDAAA
jgi:predicted DNA-binding transcriptional regulator AlpA